MLLAEDHESNTVERLLREGPSASLCCGNLYLTHTLLLQGPRQRH